MDQSAGRLNDFNINIIVAIGIQDAIYSNSHCIHQSADVPIGRTNGHTIYSGVIFTEYMNMNLGAGHPKHVTPK
jgi:hypothetical protein